MLIKNDKQVSLDQVNQLLRLSADQFDDASRRIDDAPLADWFAQLASERRDLSCELEELVRQSGELPSRPDPDKELVTNLLTGLKEAFAVDHIKHELQQRDLVEADLENALMEAQRMNQEPGMTALLSKLAAHVNTVRSRIKSILST